MKSTSLAPLAFTILLFTTSHADGRSREERWQAEIAASKNACDAGKLDECVNYGNLYLDGKSGLAVDKLRAREIFKNACERGSAMGCLNTGGTYMEDYIHGENFTEAARYFKRACALGSPKKDFGRPYYVLVGSPGCMQYKIVAKRHPEVVSALNNEAP